MRSPREQTQLRLACVTFLSLPLLALPTWTSPWDWVNPGEPSGLAAIPDDEAAASKAVVEALKVEDPVHRSAALFDSTNHYLERLTLGVAETLKCSMCLRAGEELAAITGRVKDEVSLIDEVANMCRGTDMEDDGGWIQELQEAGWEVHNTSMVQVIDESRRVTNKSLVLVQLWILRRTCFLVFPNDFEFAELAEWLGGHFIDDENLAQVDPRKAQDKLCWKATSCCKGVQVTASDRTAVPVPKKPKPSPAPDDDSGDAFDAIVAKSAEKTDMDKLDVELDDLGLDDVAGHDGSLSGLDAELEVGDEELLKMHGSDEL